MSYFKVLFFVSSCTLFSCGTANNKGEEYHVNKGEITMVADESLGPIAQAQADAYQIHYPDTKITTKLLPEQKAIRALLSDSAEVIAITRELSSDEQRYFISRKINYEPAKMAMDAIVVIANKNASEKPIGFDEIKEILNGKATGKRIVFDQSSSSTLNYVRNKLGITQISNKNTFAANGTNDAIAYVSGHSDALGIIGYNWISDDEDPAAKKLRSLINVLPIKDSTGTAYLPTVYNIRNKKYPFYRFVYLHTTQNQWGVAKGLIRFSCSQIGQLIVEKMGLVPYFIMQKNVILDKDPINTKTNED